MNLLLTFLLLLSATDDTPEVDPTHAKNSVYLQVLGAGLKVGGETVRLPPPMLRDGQGGAEQDRALLTVAGSERARDDLLRDSVAAPFVLKVRDVETEEAIIRIVDLWFVIRGDLATLNLESVVEQVGGKAVSVGNMRFESRVLTPEEVMIRVREPVNELGVSGWFVHLSARLLDRIELAVTDRVTITRSDESMVVAACTDQAFDPDDALANRWNSLAQDGTNGPTQPYKGGLSYARISRLREPTGALLVELHAAFSEPRDWFQGEPILRSKFAPIAQDQIRRLRRELSGKQSRTETEAPPG